ncbi:Putative hydroxymethyl transferase [Salmonella enterica subsp. salamae]|uniref:Hydroxymethyl transferase n=1 Tax=Salmonella enterica subsp. salamae TaxID=59202 RepID=A0A6D2G6Z8_SALER|nr:Putative hydroxymethyl transferase [Salmonella enterica subsp. salamae]
MAGELAVTCAAFPAGLENAALELILVRGEKSETLHPKAGITRFNIDAGAYAVTAAELRTAEGTIRAAVQLNASELTITKGQLTQLDITFAQAEYSTTLDLAVNLPATHALYNEDLSVVYMENGVAKQRYTMRAGQKQRLELLPVTGIYSVRIDDVKLNNIHYTFDVASGALDNQLHNIAFTNTHQNDESQSASTKLTISIDAEKTVASTFSLRLVDDSTTPRQYLFTDLAMKASSLTPPVELAPGLYQIESATVIHNGIVYYIDVAPQTLSVEKNTALTLAVIITEGANLRVKGFPDFLSFGGCANMSPSNVDDLAEARVSSLFKYSGDDGMGDASAYLDPAERTDDKNHSDGARCRCQNRR